MMQGPKPRFSIEPSGPEIDFGQGGSSLEVEPSGPDVDIPAEPPDYSDPRLRLQLVNAAIAEILISGQSYQIGTRKLTRADLKQLRALKGEIENELAAEEGSLLLPNTTAVIFRER